jgi:class 3 adenylate cyclase
MHRTGEVWPVEAARDLAERIPGARYIELEGTDHWWWVGDAGEVVGHIEEFLTGARHAPASERVLTTVLFTDIVGSTTLAARLGDRAWRETLQGHDRSVREEVARFRGRVVKAIGDGYLSTFDGPARAVDCAKAIARVAREAGLEIRAGLHTGECELMGEDVGGMAVHIASRVSSTAGPGEVLVSSTVKDLVVGSHLSFEDRGVHELKGVPGDWHLFAAGTESREPSAAGSEALAAPAQGAIWQRTIAQVGTRQPRVAQKLVSLSRRKRRNAR